VNGFTKQPQLIVINLGGHPHRGLVKLQLNGEQGEKSLFSVHTEELKLQSTSSASTSVESSKFVASVAVSFADTKLPGEEIMNNVKSVGIKANAIMPRFDRIFCMIVNSWKDVNLNSVSSAKPLPSL
jgi:hypothetical protein